MDTTDVVASLAGVAALATLALQGTVYYKLRRPQRRPPASCPPISILKPLKGVDPGLHENLEAFAKLDYPEYELIFGVEDAADPAVQLVRRYEKDHPELQVRLVIGATRVGLNPKVNNLASLARFARYDLWLISDADVRPRANYLRELVAELADERVGLVHSVLSGAGEETTGATFESLHLNSFAARAICGADTLMHHACVIGKSMLFRRAALEKLGGFAAVSDFLAEDYVLGQRFVGAGLRVALSAHVLPVVSPRRSVSSFVNRQMRWAQMRRRVNGLAYLGEVLLNPCWWLLLWCLALIGSDPDAQRSWAPFVLVAAGVVLKCAADAQLTAKLTGQRLPLRSWLWIPVKDVLISGIWLLGFVRTRIMWRGTALRIGRGSLLTRPAARERRVPPAEPTTRGALRGTA